MSDQSISIVPKVSNYPNRVVKADEILAWLINEDIVKATFSDCTLGSKLGYAVSEGARKITIGPNYSKLALDPNNEFNVIDMPSYIPTELKTNGLEIVLERTVFDTGENGIEELVCPKCDTNIVDRDWDFTPWHSSESDDLYCVQCGKNSEINNYIFQPIFGFSNLGFTFWNWPDFTDDFITRFKEKLGCDIVIVYQHL